MGKNFTEVAKIVCRTYDDVDRMESTILRYMDCVRGMCPEMFGEYYMNVRNMIIRAVEECGGIPLTNSSGVDSRCPLMPIKEEGGINEYFHTVVRLPRDFLLEVQFFEPHFVMVTMGWEGDVVFGSLSDEKKLFLFRREGLRPDNRMLHESSFATPASLMSRRKEGSQPGGCGVRQLQPPPSPKGVSDTGFIKTIADALE